MPNGHSFIAFEGPIAAGKTTLATVVAERAGYNLVLEAFAGNDFLVDFYSDSQRFALPMQLTFLLDRHAQAKRLTESMMLRPIVADYGPRKDRLFAGLLLKGRELHLYERVAAELSSACREPDLVVFLDAPTTVLLDRIAHRGRQYEARIDATYLDSLRAAYERDFAQFSGRVIRFDTATLDLKDDTAVTKFVRDLMANVES